MSYFYDINGIRRKWSDLSAVLTLEQLKKKSGSSPWPVIEKCFEIWASKNPRKYKSYLIYLDNIRQTRKDRKFASTYDKVHGGYLRYTLDIPETVILMIRTIYNPDELPMDREFFLEFARRFPRFRVAQKL